MAIESVLYCIALFYGHVWMKRHTFKEFLLPLLLLHDKTPKHDQEGSRLSFEIGRCERRCYLRLRIRRSVNHLEAADNDGAVCLGCCRSFALGLIQSVLNKVRRDDN